MKVLVRYPLALLLMVLSCGKDYSHEGTVPVQSPVSGGPAAFTLQGAGGQCRHAVKGTYHQQVPLDGSNSAELQVDVSKTGTYTLSTTAGGITFSGTGRFNRTGLQTVILQGSGTPAAAGTLTLPVTAGGTSCTFAVAVSNGAMGVLSCAAPIVSGQFSKGTGVGRLHTVQLQVDVTRPGTYSIYTNIVNGFHFFKEGIFTRTGLQPVVLEARGIPSDAVPSTFTASFGSNSCNFVITVH